MLEEKIKSICESCSAKELCEEECIKKYIQAKAIVEYDYKMKKAESKQLKFVQ